MNPIAAILAALKTFPEPPSLELDGKEPVELAEAYNRLGEIGQVVTALKRLVAEDLAAKLDGKTLRYGDTFLGPATGTPTVVDEDLWWKTVLEGLMESPRPVDLLASLFPSSSLRLTALPKLAAALGVEHDDLRKSLIGWKDPSTPLKVTPLSRAPVYLQKMEDGTIR